MSTTPQSERAAWLLPRGLLILLGIGSAVLAIAGMRAAADVVGPVFLALVLTIAVHPVHGYAQRRQWPAWTGTLLGVVLTYLILIGLCAVLLLAVARFASLVPQYQDDLASLLKGGANKLKDMGVGQQQVDDFVGSFDPRVLIEFAGDILAGLLAVVSNLFFIVPLLLFLCADAAQFTNKLNDVRAHREAVVTSLESFAHGTRRYLVVSTVFGFGVAVLDTVFLVFTPIPAPLLWGLLAFITNYIPNIGFVIGMAPPAILGLLVGGPELMVLVVVVYSGLNIAIQSVIQPKFVGDAVGLSPTITFVSLLFWAWVLGAVGALFAVPLTLLVKATLVDVDRDQGWLGQMLAGGAAPKKSSD